MLVLGWLTVVLGMLATLWADGAFAKISSAGARAVPRSHADQAGAFSAALRQGELT
jgi:hypothetical protein